MNVIINTNESFTHIFRDTNLIIQEMTLKIKIEKRQAPAVN